MSENIQNINDNNIEKPTNVTSISELKSYNRGEIVKLPDFAQGQPFYARLRRPSMMGLAKSGKIPNSLLDPASKLFVTGNVDGNAMKANAETLDKMFDIIDVICDASFVEPTYQELKDNGIELTDDQYMFIFNYSQMGVKSLENFRS